MRVALLRAILTIMDIGFGATQGVFREYYFKTPPLQGNQLVASTGLLVVVSTLDICLYH